MRTFTPLVAMVRKDLLMFFSDRRSVIMAFIVPIAIASFFGSIFSGQNTGQPARIGVAVVDEDGSTISQAIVAGVESDTSLTVGKPTADEARERVRQGKVGVAVIMPKGFGDAAGRAFFSGQAKPELSVLFDPSRTAEVAMVRGIMTEHIMKAVSQEMFTGARGRQLVDQTLSELDSVQMAPERKQLLRDLLSSTQRFFADGGAATGRSLPAGGITMPYSVRQQAVTSRDNVPYNGFAHSFAGMGIQFLLFAAANLGIEVLQERQRGLWRRLRSAPVSRVTLLAGKTLSGTLISLMTLLVSFSFAMIVFRVRILGSVAGFLSVAIACSMMAATFGLLIAALGKTPGSARGITTLAVLLMVMLGGAWVPTFVFPSWLQQVTLVVPARWAVDGLDAMTWRGIGIAGAIVPTMVLLGFAALFGGVALARFRWEEA